MDETEYTWKLQEAILKELQNLSLELRRLRTIMDPTPCEFCGKQHNRHGICKKWEEEYA